MMCGLKDLNINNIDPCNYARKRKPNVDSDGFYYVYFDVPQFRLILKYFFSFLTTHNIILLEKKKVIFKPSTT